MRPTAVLCLFALAVTGCGAAPRDSSKDFTGAERAVATAVERLETAARDDKPEVVCTRLLSSKLLDALRKQGTNCVTGVKEAFRDADSIDLTVDDVVVQGTHATVRLSYRSGSDTRTATLQLDREGGAWKISGGILAA